MSDLDQVSASKFSVLGSWASFFSTSGTGSAVAVARGALKKEKKKSAVSKTRHVYKKNPTNKELLNLHNQL